MNFRDLKKFSLRRPLTSYGKVQFFITSIVRGSRLFINKDRIYKKRLLNVGCGPFPLPEFINIDYIWHPKIDICWDITKKAYPLPSELLEGVFSEHCLEHISFEECLANLKEFYRLLKVGGIVRIVVPDGELYCDIYHKRKNGEVAEFPYGKNEATGMISINRIFRSHGHQFIYDFETFGLLLTKAGFKEVKKVSYREGSDKRLLIDRPEREIESLYIEAKKM